MSLKITNKSEFLAKVNGWVNAVRKGAERAVYRMVYDAQAHATSISPVYSGDFAASWNVAYGQPDLSFKDTTKSDRIRSSFGHPRDDPYGTGNFNLKGFKLGQTVYLSNNAQHDEPYAWAIELGVIEFRDANLGKDAVRRKTLNHLRVHYPRITTPMMMSITGV